MRAPFNTTCEIFAGPGTATPGLSRGVFPCRHVLEDGIHSQQLDPGQPWIPSYLTIQAYRPKGIFKTPKISVDPSLADRVSVPPGGFPEWTVFYTDYIVWKGQTKYYRSYLIKDSSFLSGGVVLGGLATIAGPPFNPSGGIVCGGSTGAILLTFPAGGAVLGGAAIIIPSMPLVSGGVVIGGIAITVPSGSFHPVGGIVIGGAPTITTVGPFAIVGGVVLGGVATVVPAAKYVGSGGVVLGGVATVLPMGGFIPSGGVVLGGTGSFSFTPPDILGHPIYYVHGADDPFLSSFIDFVIDTDDISSIPGVGRILIVGQTNFPGTNGTWNVTTFPGIRLQVTDGYTPAHSGPDTGFWIKL